MDPAYIVRLFGWGYIKIEEIRREGRLQGGGEADCGMLQKHGSRRSATGRYGSNENKK